MTRAAVLARGREAAEAGMADACSVQRETAVITDDLDPSIVTPTLVGVYSGKCRIQQSIAMGQRTEAGEVSVVVLRLELQLPVIGSENIARGDIVILTAAVNDPSLIGRRFTIRDLHHKSEATSRRMTIEERT